MACVGTTLRWGWHGTEAATCFEEGNSIVHSRAGLSRFRHVGVEGEATCGIAEPNSDAAVHVFVNRL